MKVWRGVTLGFWILVLTFFLSVTAVYYSLQHTVLNAGVAKQRLAENGTYEMLRDTVLVDKSVSLFQDKYPGNTLLDNRVFKTTLREVFPTKKLDRELDPVVDSVYAWLDSKQPAITFSIPVEVHQEQFYRSLEVAVTNKISTLPSCERFYYSASEAVLNAGCLPDGVKTEDIRQAVSLTIRTGDFPLGASITNDTFAIPALDNTVVKELPTYLNYLWVLNYVAIAMVVIIAIFLTVKRKLLGITALGIALLLTAIIVVFIKLSLATILPVRSALGSAIENAVVPPLQTMLSQLALGGALAGFIFITVTSLWFWWRRGKNVRA